MISSPATALVFEGGGMRNAYTAACVHQLIEHDVQVGWVGGISAGASHTVNFLSHDKVRARQAFVEFGADPRTGGMRSFIRGTGYFNAEYIYETAGAPDNDLPFDWEAFSSDPTPFKIGATKVDTGETVYFGREHARTPQELFRQVRCSSTLPGLMPVPSIDGEEYVDGALGSSGGLAVEAAIEDGFEKFLIIRTRPRGFRRVPPKRPQLVKQWLRKRPAVAEAVLTRHERYNRAADLIDELEESGQALVFYPEKMRIANTERNLAKLTRTYHDGMEQTVRQWGDWVEFLTA